MYAVCSLSGPSVKKELKRELTNFFHSCKKTIYYFSQLKEVSVQLSRWISFVCNLFQFSCEPSTARACKNCVWGRASWVIGIYCDCLTALLIHHQLRDQCGQSKWSPHHFQFEFTVNKSIIWEMVTSLLSISSGRLLVPWPSWVVRTLLKMECLDQWCVL